MAGTNARSGALWRVFGSRRLYTSRWVNLDLVDVEKPDGVRFEHHVVRMQRVAVAVVLNADDEILMLRRHRFIDDSWGWEVPVGIVERGEDPVLTAYRETEEETGWRPLQLDRALTFQPAIGIADSEHFVFVGEGAEYAGPPREQNEADEVAWVPIGDVKKMIADGSVRDGASLVGLLHVLTSRSGA
jgi:8-oxo-dGTP pyrophosphatase MutT (NUDIX family)